MPRRGVAHTFSRGLYDVTGGGRFRVNPTLAPGDFRISKDGGAFVNLATLPVVSPSGSALVQVSVTATEMTADRVTIWGRDQAGGEWSELMEHFDLGPESVAARPTALEVADSVLTRDWTALVATIPSYCLLNAARFLRNAWTLVAGTPPILHVRQEDGVSDAWARPVTTNATAEPITGVQ